MRPSVTQQRPVQARTAVQQRRDEKRRGGDGGARPLVRQHDARGAQRARAGRLPAAGGRRLAAQRAAVVVGRAVRQPVRGEALQGCRTLQLRVLLQPTAGTGWSSRA